VTTSRAQAILDAVERVAAEHAAGIAREAAAPPAPVPAPPPATPGPPRADWSVVQVALPATPPGQILALVDQVVAATEAAKRRLDELAATIDELTHRVDAALRQAPAAPAPPPPRADVAAPSEGASSTARLVAIEMAVGGATRSETEARLRDELGTADPQPILDDVFGAGSAPGARMPWGER